jgi:dolichyl-diphosphooligosaccharide--protein glycosyltransferase/undecaprenyl-diphosphooligosaccharide--protein glycosyltransferase
MPTVFADNTIKVLDDLKKISNREDYVLSWWDYGYPIRYYSDVKTLIDGGKHSGSVNFPVSYALSTTDQKASVNMAKLDVYFNEYAYNNNKSHDCLTLMMDKYKYKDPNKFLANINSVEVPKIKEDIYYFLPSKMLGIFPTVKTFSDLNLKTGEQNKPKFFHIASRYKAYPNGDIDLGRGIKLIQNRYLKIGEQNVPLNKITITMYDNNLKLHKREATINPRSNLNLIFLRDYRMFIVLDNEYYNSTYIKLFVLEDYDKTLFEPVILTPDAKIYKVK